MNTPPEPPQIGAVRHRTKDELEWGLPAILESPVDVGILRMIVRRPGIGEREVVQEGVLDARVGLVGDTWSARVSPRTEDGAPHPDMQLNLMNARTIELIAGPEDRWPLAGDQLYVDLNLSEANLPPGTRLAIGSAVIEVTDQPHRGCAKFMARFGADALRFVNSAAGREHNLRGVNAKVVTNGRVRRGDQVIKLPPS